VPNKENTSITIITNFCPPYRLKLFEQLSKLYNAEFLFQGKGKRKEAKYLPIIRKSNFSFVSKFGLIRRLFLSKSKVIIKADIGKIELFIALLLSKVLRKRFVVWNSTWYYPQTFRYRILSPILIFILKYLTDATVVYGKHGENFLIKKGVNPKKIFVAWQTVDNKLYGRLISHKEQEFLKKKLNLKADKIVLYVGRFEETKGLPYLLEALKYLKKDGINFTFLCVGDGNLKRSIEEFCSKNGLDLILTDFIKTEDLPLYYKISSLLVLPSITTKTSKETWGLAVNEAMNQGIPVIVTDAVGAGVGGLVQNGTNGLVVPEKDILALYKGLRRLLSNEPERIRMGQNAKQIISGWTYERMAKGFVEAINYALDKKIDEDSSDT